MSSLQHILAEPPSAAPAPPAPAEPTTAAMPPPSNAPKKDTADDHRPTSKAGSAAAPEEPLHTATTATTRRNASGSVSSVYSGNKIKHLKKDDGIPLWRKDIQYDFLRLVFDNQTKCFTKYSDGRHGFTFAEIYIDAMAKSSKCSKILKEKLLQDLEGAISMAMVCLLVNVGRMNTTLNFFPEMRAQLRTYHSIPALQAHQDPNAYKQLQDAPRLKSILKGATEDEPQPGTLEDIKVATMPRTNPVNLIFVMSQYAPKISETHFNPPRDFFELVMRGSLSSASRARAFLWLIWWYLESDFSYEDSQRNPFGPGQYGEGEEGTGALPVKVPALESLTEEQAALENVDTEEEKHYGEIKRQERIAILATEPSPAMIALKRSRKEKSLTGGGLGVHASDDEANEASWHKIPHATSTPRYSGVHHDTASDYTRSPSPALSHGFQAVNLPAKSGGDMRINNLLNGDMSVETSPSHAGASAASGSAKKGLGRGGGRRGRTKQDNVPLAVRASEGSHHVPLFPKTESRTGPDNFSVGDLPYANTQPTTPGGGGASHATNGTSHSSPYHGGILSFHSNARDHVPTPSFQAQKRGRGVTQHQSAILNHRKQQIDYTLDRRIRRLHARSRDDREGEGSIMRAWKRIRLLPAGYDSEEESIRVRKARERVEKDDDYRAYKGKENIDASEDLEMVRRPKVLLAGMAGEASDVGEEAKMVAKALRRASRRLERWQEIDLPGSSMLRRRKLEIQGPSQPHRRSLSSRHYRRDADVAHEEMTPRRSVQRQRSGTGHASEHRAGSLDNGPKPGDEDGGGGELDEEDRELLGEVDADESDENEDEEMAD